MARPLLRIKPGVDLRLDPADSVFADADRFRELASFPFTAQMVAAVVDPLYRGQVFEIDELHIHLANRAVGLRGASRGDLCSCWAARHLQSESCQHKSYKNVSKTTLDALFGSPFADQ